MANFYGYSPQPFVFDKIVDALPDIESDKDIALGRYILVQEKDASGKVIGGSIYVKAYENNQYIWKLISYLPMSNSTITNIGGGFEWINGEDLGLQLSVTTEGFTKQDDGVFIPVGNTISYDIDTNVLDTSFKSIEDILTMIVEGDLTVGKASRAREANFANKYSTGGAIDKKFAAIHDEIESHITINPTYQEGDKIADIELGGTPIKLYAPKTDLSNYYNKSEVDNAIKNVKVDLSDYYTKGEVDDKISKVDLSNYYTKDEVDTNFLTANEAKNNYVAKNEVTGTLVFEGFEIFNSNNDTTLTIGIQNSSGKITKIEADGVYDNIVYGQYTIGKLLESYSFDTTYPLITTSVGYKSTETINVKDWASYVLNSNSWTRIKYIASQGLAKQYWNLGDTKDITLDNIIYKATILDFDHDGKNTITFGLCDVSDGITVSKGSNPCLYEGLVAYHDYCIKEQTLQDAIQTFTTKLLNVCNESNLKLFAETDKPFYLGNTSTFSLWQNNQRYVFIPSDKEIIGYWNVYENQEPTDGKDKQYEFFNLNPIRTNRLYNRIHEPNVVPDGGYTWRVLFRREVDEYQITSYAPRSKSSNKYTLYDKNSVLMHSKTTGWNYFDYLFMWVIG